MSSSIRTFVRHIVPDEVLFSAWSTYCKNRARRAKQAFLSAPAEPGWLGREELQRLQAEFPLPRLSYAYDEASIDRRGQTRAREVNAMAERGRGPAARFLDLGSWDGKVCYYLRALGKTAVGIDTRIEGYSEQALNADTLLLGMDAAQLGFADDSFDFVLSYNSFEHFPRPDEVLREAVRVVRPGGQIYLNFGPLWLSPRGAHQFKTITVPYCESLFPLPLIEEFAADEGLELIDFAQMNQWTLNQYRDLWPEFAGRLQTERYFETYNADYVDLIERYPSCFRSRTECFDDLIVSNIEALFTKVG